MPTMKPTFKALVALLALNSVASYGTGSVADVNEVARYCLTSEADETVVDKCTSVLGRANMDGANGNVTFVCVPGGSVTKCIDKIFAGEADLTTLENSNDPIFSMGLVPLVSAAYDDKDNDGFVYGVAVVPKELCDELDGNVTMADLKGRDACFTGYQRTQGWVLPAGALLASGAMHKVGEDPYVEDVAESMVAFFGQLCAPQGVVDAQVTPEGLAQEYMPLCDGCKEHCSKTDLNFSYDSDTGSATLRCLTEGSDNVAFVHHTALIDFAKDGPETRAWWDDFRLVCPRGGGCAQLSDYKQCNYGKSPWFSITGAGRYFLTLEGTAVRAALVAAAEGEEGRQWLRDLAAIGKGRLMDKHAVGLNTISNEDVLGLIPEDVITHYLSAVSMPKTARFCVTSEIELERCLEVVAALEDYEALSMDGSGLAWGCVQRKSVPNCMLALSEGEAEMRVMDAGQLYAASRQYNLTAIVSEQYGPGDGDASYYAVAVVDKKFCEDNEGNVTLANLRSLNSCHTGYRRSTGWWMPVAALAEEGLLEADTGVDTNVAADAIAVASFFNKVCAPGMSADGGPAFVPPANASNDPPITTYYAKLCTACADNCTEADAYGGYKGALRGLYEGACEVALTKHSAPLEYTADGSEAAPWASKAKDDLRLVCRGGGCKPVEEYEQCNLGHIPGHVVAVSQMLSYPMQELMDALVDASQDMETSERMFEKEGFWGEQTSFLAPINEMAREYLGESYGVFEKLYSEAWVDIPDGYRPKP